MQTAILVTPKDSVELGFISEFFKKTNVKSKVLTLEEMEDFGLGLLMEEADKTKKVSKETIMKKLKA